MNRVSKGYHRSSCAVADSVRVHHARPYMTLYLNHGEHSLPETAEEVGLDGVLRIPRGVNITDELYSRPRFILAGILVLADTAGAGGMAPPASTRIPARLKCVQEYGSARPHGPDSKISNLSPK